MFARIAMLALVAGCVMVIPARAAILISIVNLNPTATGPQGQSQTAVQSDFTSNLGTLPFSLNTITSQSLTSLSTAPMTVDLFSYSLGTPTVNVPDSQLAADVRNYDLSINIQDTSLGASNLGTIDLLGTGQGGYASVENPPRTFITDVFGTLPGREPLMVNGSTVTPSGFGDFANFSIPYGSQFLNIALVDPQELLPNGNQDPTTGLRLTLFLSDSPEFDPITSAPTPQRQRAPGDAVPEPASAVVLGFGALAAGLVKLRRRNRTVAA